MLLPTAHGDLFVTAFQHDLPLRLAIPRFTLETPDRPSRYQAVAMHAYEAFGILLLETAQRVFDQILAFGRAHRDVFELGLEVKHVFDGYEMNSAALLRREKRG